MSRKLFLAAAIRKAMAPGHSQLDKESTMSLMGTPGDIGFPLGRELKDIARLSQPSLHPFSYQTNWNIFHASQNGAGLSRDECFQCDPVCANCERQITLCIHGLMRRVFQACAGCSLQACAECSRQLFVPNAQTNQWARESNERVPGAGALCKQGPNSRDQHALGGGPGLQAPVLGPGICVDHIV